MSVIPELLDRSVVAGHAAPMRGWAAVVVVAVLGVVGCSDYPKDESAPWAVIESSPESPTLHIKAWFGGCSSFLRTEVHETATTVRLRAVVHTTGNSCKADLRLQDLIVTLDAPLGDRQMQGECDPAADPTCAELKGSSTTGTT